MLLDGRSTTDEEADTHAQKKTESRHQRQQQQQQSSEERASERRASKDLLAACNETVRASNKSTNGRVHRYCYSLREREKIPARLWQRECTGVTVTLDESRLASGARPSRVCSTNANVLAAFESFSMAVACNH